MKRMFMLFAILLAFGCGGNQRTHNLALTWAVQAGNTGFDETIYSAIAFAALPDRSYVYATVAHGCIDPRGKPYRFTRLASGYDDPDAPHVVTIAHVLATDSIKDICLLRSFHKPASLPLLQLTPPEPLTNVYATGTPWGVSATLSVGEYLRRHIMQPQNHVYYHTAPLAQGFSGGGLWTKDHKLLGINNLMVSNCHHCAFAIPITDVFSFWQDIQAQLPDPIPWGIWLDTTPQTDLNALLRNMLDEDDMGMN